jgi:hypothetical protein
MTPFDSAPPFPRGLPAVPTSVLGISSNAISLLYSHLYGPILHVFCSGWHHPTMRSCFGQVPIEHLGECFTHSPEPTP